MQSAEIIPVEPDPDHAGERKRGSVFKRFRVSGSAFFVRRNRPASAEEKMKVIVNGKIHEHKGGGAIMALLEELDANPAHTALMLNGEVLPSSEWKTAVLKENDDVEMLVFVGGG